MAKIGILQATAAGLRGIERGLAARDDRQEKDQLEKERQEDRQARKDELDFRKSTQVSQTQSALEKGIRDEARDREQSKIRSSVEKRSAAKAKREETEFDQEQKDHVRKDALNKIKDQTIRDAAESASISLMDEKQLFRSKRVGRSFHEMSVNNNAKLAIEMIQPLYDKTVIGVRPTDGNLIVDFEDGTRLAHNKTAVARSLRASGIIGVKDDQLLRENRAEIASLGEAIKSAKIPTAKEIEAEKDPEKKASLDKLRVDTRAAISDAFKKIEALKIANVELGRPSQPSVPGRQDIAGLPADAPDSLIAREVAGTTLGAFTGDLGPGQPPPPGVTPGQPPGTPAAPGAQPTLRLPLGGGQTVPSAPGPAGQAAAQPAAPGGFDIASIIQAGVPEGMARSVDTNQDGQASNEELNDLLTKANRLLEPKSQEDVTRGQRATEFQKEQARQTKRAIENLLKGRAQTLVGGQ